VYGPADRYLTEEGVQRLSLALDPAREPLGVDIDLPSILSPALQNLSHGAPDHVTLVEREKSILAGCASAQKP
jgi:hypothetical protein